jgi:dTDP-4-dehydrorhamnose reductase
MVMAVGTPVIRLPELWAGVECTVNRVGDQYFDQIQWSGHELRANDIDRLAKLGISAVRYPILWERTAPKGLEHADWTWADERLNRLRQLELKPIVGLLHHGSGPRYTNLLDASFPEKFAEFASAVAQRYRWLSEFTPVNEPLTTARFSALYGHWYPHAHDALAFATAFLSQCRGVAMAMRAIRVINSDAKLVQTEDLGKTFSTPTLAYQADFENERRWLTFDLLTGRVIRGHAMFDYLRWLGIKEVDLLWFVNNPCPPDTIGINHYITSERFLDERRSRYPESAHGGNGHDRYADVEAVRVCAEGVAGPKTLIQETWDRYGLPIAITEAHLGCTREEQLRWLKTIWDAARESRQEGIDVRAVTVWAAFGSYNWNTLLTTNNGHYEPGIFDVRSKQPRPTALVGMVRKLAKGESFDHPCLDTPGWWQRFDRLCYPAVSSSRPTPILTSVRTPNLRGAFSRPLLITGASGTLGGAFARSCERRGLAYYLLTRKELDIAESSSIEAAMERYEPWAVVNAAGYVRVDDAEQQRDICLRENSIGPALLAASCKAHGISLLAFSSDLVFNGKLRRPYLESDHPAPLNVYGATKLKAEKTVLEVLPQALVIRTSAFFGPWDQYNFASAVLDAMVRNSVFRAPNDTTISPTYVPDLVDASLDLLVDGERGVWHLSNGGAVTWADFARLLAQESGYDPSLIKGQPGRLLGLRARRPTYSALASERGTLLPRLEDAVTRFLATTASSRRTENVSAWTKHAGR